MNSQSRTLDRRQLKTLLRTSLLLDWRGASSPFSGFGEKKRTKVPGIVIMLIIYLVASIFLGAVFLVVRDLFTGLVQRRLSHDAGTVTGRVDAGPE